jgi:hypothetical protein
MSRGRLSSGIESSNPAKEMTVMYSPLNEDFMFEEMKNRKESLLRPHRDDIAVRAGRRWWRRTAHRAG